MFRCTFVFASYCQYQWCSVRWLPVWEYLCREGFRPFDQHHHFRDRGLFSYFVFSCVDDKHVCLQFLNFFIAEKETIMNKMMDDSLSSIHGFGSKKIKKLPKKDVLLQVEVY